MDHVSTLVENANNILDAAEAMRVAGHKGADWSILIGSEGHIHMVRSNDWPLESLRNQHGASQAYRVSQQNGRIEIHGTDQRRDVMIASASAAEAVRRLLPERREYKLPERCEYKIA